MADSDYEAFNQVFTENSAWLEGYIKARLFFPEHNKREAAALRRGLGALAVVNNEATALSEVELQKAYGLRDRLLWQYNPTWARLEMELNPYQQHAAIGDLVDFLIQQDIA